MGVAMMLWAVVSALTAVSKNFTGLLLTRFFLGLTEAPYYPGAVYLLSICKFLVTFVSPRLAARTMEAYRAVLMQPVD